MGPKKNKKKAVADDEDLDFLDSLIAENQVSKDTEETENEKAGIDDTGDDAGNDEDNEDDNDEEGGICKCNPPLRPFGHIIVSKVSND